MTLSADPDPPVYGRGVLGWEEEEEEMEEEKEPAGAHRVSGGGVAVEEEEEEGADEDDGEHGRRGEGAVGRGGRRTRARKHHRMGRESTRLGTLQVSMRRRFVQMEMGVCR